MRWYYDFISPYAYLQSTRLDELSQLETVECIPVLFAGLLKNWDNKGPAEIAPKRKWTLRDIVWLAHKDAIPLQFPPQHPFNPLPLLRLAIVHNNQTEVVQRLFRYVWVEGKSPQDEVAFSELLSELNTSAEALKTDNVKTQLHSNGQLASDSGVFGVPTIEHNNDIFWGYSATDMVISLLTKPDSFPTETIKNADALPEGPGRRLSPAKSTTANPSPRIPLKPIDLAEPAELVQAIRKRRGGQLIELDRLLLYSQPLAEGWNHYIGNIRTEFSIDQKLRELAMCTVAVLNRAEYEFTQHAPLYIKAGGSEAKSQLLRNPDTAQKHPDFTDAEQLTIALTTQLTRDVYIDQVLFERSQKYFGNEDLVELIATIAAYNMVSRFLVAFELHP